MLILSRKRYQSVRIGDQITVTVSQIRGNQVRLAIEAPLDVRILRSEIPPDAGIVRHVRIAPRNPVMFGA